VPRQARVLSSWTRRKGGFLVDGLDDEHCELVLGVVRVDAVDHSQVRLAGRRITEPIGQSLPAD
jgi:hypothetical protein